MLRSLVGSEMCIRDRDDKVLPASFTLALVSMVAFELLRRQQVGWSPRRMYGDITGAVDQVAKAEAQGGSVGINLSELLSELVPSAQLLDLSSSREDPAVARSTEVLYQNISKEPHSF
eukprot:TRINITY_DN50826_c0_g1_i1.p1 TRINITY_DN50826_c0_g1~~TRINITY_DN50826_c0_g1_i1.p1  ORF type:complete len:128 (+),score=35.58 TRINITY_DN50826_c0_g1_i1:32-385(+)